MLFQRQIGFRARRGRIPSPLREAEAALRRLFDAEDEAAG